MVVTLIADPSLLCCTIINEKSFPEVGTLVIKSTDGQFLKCLPFLNSPHLVEENVIKVPRDLLTYEGAVYLNVIKDEETPVVEKVLLSRVHGNSPFEIKDDCSVYTFKGDIITNYTDGHMNIFKVSDTFSDSVVRLTKHTVTEYIKEQESLTEGYLLKLFDGVMEQVKGRVSFIFGLPKVLETVAWKSCAPKLDVASILRDEPPKSLLTEEKYYVFHGEFLQQKSVDRLLIAIQNSACSFVFFMGIAGEAHSLVDTLERYFECKRLHFPPLSIDQISLILNEHQIYSISPSLLAGLSLDSILSIIKDNDDNIEEMVRKAQEEHWKSFGVVLNPNEYSWNKVIGYEADIKHLRNYIFAQYQHPEQFKALGLKAPKGILLHGPSGCGKTLIARTLSSDRYCTVIEIRTVLLYSKYFGETEERIRQVFANARQRAPCILMFDEFEGVGVKRSLADEADTTGVAVRVLTTLLNELDGVHELEGVTVVACTNRKEVIDEALLRPGRLDVHIEIKYPLEVDLDQFLKEYLKSHEHSLNMSSVRDILKGKSFGNVKMLIDNAALNAYIRKSPLLQMQDLEDAIKN